MKLIRIYRYDERVTDVFSGRASDQRTARTDHTGKGGWVRRDTSGEKRVKTLSPRTPMNASWHNQMCHWSHKIWMLKSWSTENRSGSIGTRVGSEVLKRRWSSLDTWK